MRKKMESMEMKQIASLKKELVQQSEAVGKYAFIGKICEGVGPEALRKLGGELRQESPALLVVLAILNEGKPFVVVGKKP